MGIPFTLYCIITFGFHFVKHQEPAQSEQKELAFFVDLAVAFNL
jgi:hypothetical protein